MVLDTLIKSLQRIRHFDKFSANKIRRIDRITTYGIRRFDNFWNQKQTIRKIQFGVYFRLFDNFAVF